MDPPDFAASTKIREKSPPPNSAFGAWGRTSALSSPFLGKSRVLPQRCYCYLLEGNQYILQSTIPSQMP